MRTSWIGAAAVIVAAACSGEPFDALQGGPGAELAYEGQAVIMESFPAQLRTWVNVRNDGSTPQTVHFPDGCVVLLRVYRTADLGGPPAWDQGRRVGCHAAVVPLTVRPGEMEEVGAPDVSAAEVLGDSLPDGRYYLAAVIRPDGETRVLPTGQADLAIPR